MGEAGILIERRVRPPGKEQLEFSSVPTILRPPWPLLKRAIDLLIAGIALAACLPIFGFAALCIWLEDGRPVLFRQRRAGRSGRPFDLLKFRSMRRNDAAPDALGQVREDHPLVTRVGRWLRRFKIDELPQIVNVLRGEMSVVGPRPDLCEHAEGYDAFQRRRLLVRPGITGWAQTHGNTRLSWPERIAMDVWYVDHASIGLDAIVLARTIGVVLAGERADDRSLQESLDHETRARGSR